MPLLFDDKSGIFISFQKNKRTLFHHFELLGQCQFTQS